MIWFVPLMIASYLLGSINTSIIYSLGNYKKDIRTQGSGNAGATNMLRSFGKMSAAVTFLGDILKAVIAIGMAWIVFRHSACLTLIKALIGLACVLGHCFPIFFKFQGGKGIATGAGCILMIDWRVFVVAILLFAIIVIITRYVSLGSLVGALTYPVGMLICGKPIATVIVTAITSALLWWRHKENIVRLLHGEEKKIGK